MGVEDVGRKCGAGVGEEGGGDVGGEEAELGGAEEGRDGCRGALGGEKAC